VSGFHTPYSTPTDEQAALVGHIVMAWAITEFNLRHLASRLAMMPDMPGRSITEGMTGHATIERIEWLLHLHAHHYGDQVIGAERRVAIADAVQLAKSVRGERNTFAHHISFRTSDDQLDFFSLGGKQPAPSSYEKVLQLHELKNLRRKIVSANDALETATGLIPEWTERKSEASA